MLLLDTFDSAELGIAGAGWVRHFGAVELKPQRREVSGEIAVVICGRN
jgi:hypothetical protein